MKRQDERTYIVFRWVAERHGLVEEYDRALRERTWRPLQPLQPLLDMAEAE